MAEDFKIISTQEEFDAAIKSRIERCTRTVTDEVTKKFEGYISPDEAAKLNKKIEEMTAQSQKDTDTIAQLTAANKKFETSSVKQKIAHETGIPFELADRLAGETEEEIRADADKFSAFMRPTAPSPKFTGEAPAADSTAAAFAAMAQELNGGT